MDEVIEPSSTHEIGSYIFEVVSHFKQEDAEPVTQRLAGIVEKQIRDSIECW